METRLRIQQAAEAVFFVSCYCRQSELVYGVNRVNGMGVRKKYSDVLWFGDEKEPFCKQTVGLS